MAMHFGVLNINIFFQLIMNFMERGKKHKLELKLNYEESTEAQVLLNLF